MKIASPLAPAPHSEEPPMLPLLRLKAVTQNWFRRPRPVSPGVRPGSLDRSWYGAAKIALEWTFAAGLLVATAPLIFVAGLLVKLTSRGPVFYTQTRVGKNGKLFTIYKIRTMVANCENSTGAKWATRNDPRVTAVGTVLRKTHIDELPQLLNILRGDMSLVGPRPERPEFVPSLERAIPRYRDRLTVRPGITGVAQVQLPPDTDLASVQRKLAYDLYYVRHVGFWLDLRLILCTAIHVLGVPYHVVGRLFFLPGRDEVEAAYYQGTTTTTREPILASALAV